MVGKKNNFIKKEQDNNERKKRNRKLLFFVAFFTAVFLTVSTYAWLSTSLNVKIKFFEMSVQSDSGLFISLDGIDFSDHVVVSMDSIIVDLFDAYPNHTNQWSARGLWPVSTAGIRSTNNAKFDVYRGFLNKTKTYNPNGSIKRILNTYKLDEDVSASDNIFIAFDVFLKNASGSPNPDNLYLEETTGITFEEDVEEDIKESMSGIMNSMRMGIVFIGSVPHKSNILTIQNVQCNNRCSMLIYEPYSYEHSPISIETAKNYGVNLVNGTYVPTYAITAIGKNLEHTNGHIGTGIPLITSHFQEQQTIKQIDPLAPIYQIPNGITKLRVYIWLEGQDIDSLEVYSKGAPILLNIDLMKDLAGYE